MALMPRYLLDTNICMYIAKRKPPEVLARFERLAVGELAMLLSAHPGFAGAQPGLHSAKPAKR